MKLRYRGGKDTSAPYGVRVISKTGSRVYHFYYLRARDNFIKRAVRARNFVRYQLFYND